MYREHPFAVDSDLTVRLNPYSGARRYLRIFRSHLGRRLYLIFALAILAAAMEGIGITLLLPLISALEVNLLGDAQTPEMISKIVTALGLEKSPFGLLLLVWAAFLLKGLITFAYQAYGGILQANLQYQLQRRLYEGIISINYAFYADRSTGHFVNLINSQVSAFYQSYATYQQFMVNAIKAITYLGIAMLVAWRFGLMAIVAGVILILAFRYLNSIVKQLSIDTVSEMTVLNKLLVQLVQAFKYLTSTNRMPELSAPIESSMGKVRGYRRRQMVWFGFTSALTEPLSVSLILTVIIIQVALLHQSLAPILVSILLFHRGMTALMTLQSQWQQTMNNIGAVEVLEREFAAMKTHRDGNGSRFAPNLSEGMELRDVSYAYPGTVQPALSQVDLNIPARSTVALVGRSGAGKSTLVDLLTLLLRPSDGDIYIDGVAASELEKGSWRRQIGYVSQETVVFDDSIAANVVMRPVTPDTDQMTLDSIHRAISKAHLDDVISQLPDGIWTQVGERGIRLSGGQRQRLFIARELFRQPRLLILDEATSALDGESEARVQESIDELKGEVTLVVIAHRLTTVRKADLIYVLEAGRVVECGTYEDLRDRPEGQFAAMIELQSL